MPPFFIRHRFLVGIALLLLTLTPVPGAAQTLLVSQAPSWKGKGTAAFRELGGAVAPAGDFNGDGYGDLIVGGPAVHNTETSFVAVFYGSAAGLTDGVYSSVAEGQDDAQFGLSVTWLGDMNGDGFDDVAAGAPMYKDTYARQGMIRVLFGRRSANIGFGTLIVGPSPRAQFGYAVCGGGDIDGDGANDLVVGAPQYEGADGARGALYVYRGGSPFSTTAGWFYASVSNGALGSCLAGCGDVDGDGYNDVVAGAPEYDDGTGVVGAVYVFFGDGNGLGPGTGRMVTGPTSGTGFGRDVAMGDFNGDGFSDIAVTAPDFVDTSSHAVGRVLIYYSTAQGDAFDAPVMLTGGRDAYGTSVESAGDLNRDGIADLAVGTSRGYERRTVGAAYLYAGASGGIAPAATQIVSASRPAGDNAGYFRLTAMVACAGDLNGDGVTDLAIGNGFDDGLARGEFMVHHGLGVRGGELSVFPGAALVESDPGSRTGSAVASAGDVDGDGWDDLLVGDSHDGRFDAGAARVHRGSPDGWQSAGAWSAHGTVAGERFGYAVAGVGDVDGDGFSDVAVGAPHATIEVGDEGAVFVYRGSLSGLATAPDFIGRGGTRAAGMGFAVAGAGDVNGDGFSDVLVGASLAGRARVYYGNPYSLSDSLRWDAQPAGSDSWFGYAVATAGDVNADGYSDVVIGAPHFSDGQEDEGALFIYHGSAEGLPAAPSAVIELDRAGAMLGVSVSSAGDANGDYFGDIIAGAGGSATLMGELGNAFLFAGADDGVRSTPSWSTLGDPVGGSPGFAVCGLGDVNGDGYADVAVGDPLSDAATVDGGRVRVFIGGSSGPGTAPRWILDGTDPGGRFGSVVSPAFDVTGDGRADMIVGAPASSLSRVSLYAMPTPPAASVYPRQVPPDAGGQIAVRGFSGDAGAVHLRTRSTHREGVSTVRLQYQFVGPGQAWSTHPIVDSQFTTLTPEERRTGMTTTLDVRAVPGTAIAGGTWRVRVVADSPWVGTTRWFTHHADVTSEPVVRIGIAPDVPPPPEPGPGGPPPRIPFAIERVYPVPFNPDVTVRYALDITGRIDVSVFDVRGAHIATLRAGVVASGRHQALWDGRDQRGNAVSSGVYFVRVKMGARSVAERLVLIR